MENIISKDIINNAYEYEDYKKILEDRINNSHPKNDTTERLLEFTKLNLLRMKRIEKSIKIKQEAINKINSIQKNIILLVIAEGWCGDVAQNLPVIYMMVKSNHNIGLKIIFRDENPDVMNNFLTNGTKSIPVVIMLDVENLNFLAKWGPRPAPAQEIMVKWKQRKDYDHDRAVKEIQLWYLEDAGSTIQEEFSEIFEKVIPDED